MPSIDAKSMGIENYKNRYFVAKSINLEISREKMWDLISSPGHLNQCHPFCHTNSVIKWSDGSYVDELIYLNGLRYIRHFHQWFPNKGYELLIGEESGPQSYVVWELSSISSNQCNLQIKVYPYILANWSRILSYIPYNVYIKPRIEKYLISVLSGFEYYIDNKKDVPRNNFGKHSWFSK